MDGTKVKSARLPTNIHDLYELCQEEWSNIPPSFCQKLVNGYQKRLIAVKKAKGQATKY